MSPSQGGPSLFCFKLYPRFIHFLKLSLPAFFSLVFFSILHTICLIYLMYDPPGV